MNYDIFPKTLIHKYFKKGRVFININNKLEQNTKSSSHTFFTSFIDDLKNHISQDTLENHTLFLDRFEGNYAICENKTTGKMITIPKSMISSNAKDGDVLKLKKNMYITHSLETKNKKQKIDKLFSELSSPKANKSK